MTCEICGHRPHPGFRCAIPDGRDPMDICECPFDNPHTPTDQPSLFFDSLPSPDENHPGFVRRDARDTSVAAAKLVAPRTGSWRRKVLDAIAEYPKTDESLILVLQGSPNTIRPRRVELLDDGWIEDSGERRQTSTGAQAAVWCLTDRGREELGA